MISAKAFLRKVVSIRAQLIRSGRNQKNLIQVCRALEPIQNWIKAYPNATELATLKFIKANQESILIILPGKGCKAYDRLMQDFNALTSIPLYNSL